MKDFDTAIVKNNVIELIRYSGITYEELVNIIDISIRKLNYIKNNNSTFNIKDIEKICKFFNISFSVITTEKIKLKKNFREELARYHKDNLQYKAILTDKPSIPFAIDFILIDHPEFANKSLEVKEINGIFKALGYNYSPSSLTNELIKSKSIQFEKHPTKKGTHLYSKKQT